MNNFANFQPEDLLKAAKEARIPENMQQFAGETVAKTQEAYENISDAAADNAKAAQEVLSVAQTGAKELSEKVAENLSANTQAAFDAAKAIATASTLPEAAKLQADFLQQQFAVAGAQTKEFFELSTKLTQETLQMVNSATAKSFEKMKAAGQQ